MAPSGPPSPELSAGPLTSTSSSQRHKREPSSISPIHSKFESANQIKDIICSYILPADTIFHTLIYHTHRPIQSLNPQYMTYLSALKIRCCHSNTCNSFQSSYMLQMFLYNCTIYMVYTSILYLYHIFNSHIKIL